MADIARVVGASCIRLPPAASFSAQWDRLQAFVARSAIDIHSDRE